ERPSTRPGAPETATKIRCINPNLDRKRPGEGLTNRDGFPHLFFCEPSTICHQFPLHLANECNGSSKPQKPKPQKVEYKFADPTGRNRYGHRHRNPLSTPETKGRGSARTECSRFVRINLPGFD